MSGLALIADQLGAAVSGSDSSESAYTHILAAAGIEFNIGHDSGNVPKGAEVVISTAIPKDNPELQRAQELGLNIKHRGQLLADLCELKDAIAVCGTHGKTTTAGMVAHILRSCGDDPAFVIGGEIECLGGNAGWGRGWLVVEADESDRSFLLLKPKIAVVTNIELDHHTTYGSKTELEAAFASYLGNAGEGGAVVIPGGLALDRLIAGGKKQVLFGLERDSDGAEAGGHLTANGIKPEGGSTSFTLCLDGEDICDLTLPLTGRHNVLNALAALAACKLAGFDLREAASALQEFKGAERRFQHKGSFNGAEVYDDYAHHPSEVEAALESARQLSPRRVVAVFQPHLYSRTLNLAREFGRALARADVVMVTDVYAARESPLGELAGVSGKMVADAVADHAGGRAVYWLANSGELLAALKSELREGDLALTIGAGDIYKTGERLVNEAERS